MNYDLVLHNIGTLVTCQGHATPAKGEALKEAGIIYNCSVAINDGVIVLIAPGDDAPDLLKDAANSYDVGGRMLLPGFVDPHTHLVYAGDRSHEYDLKLQGVPYLEILRQGGGILSTVRQTRAASKEQLIRQSLGRLTNMLRHGTTTAEVKTGYGLNTVTELLQLQVIAELSQNYPVELVATFMPAHAIPPEFAQDRQGYIQLMITEMFPQAKGLAAFCDVFCEEGVFTVPEARFILQAAQNYGMRPKLHADELSSGGGSQLAAELKAISADHLLQTDAEGIAAMAKAGVIGVCLPATSLNLAAGHYAPARAMLEQGMAIALASDVNPGSCPCDNMQLVITLACLYLKLTPAEAIVAATINAAHAIGMADKIGSIEVGKQADFILCDIPNLAYLPYRFGLNHVQQVFKKGWLVRDNT
ncbi:MAG: imidazolonepropionase [Symbiobacteriaceae bacterium]|nr:imidazolonepropionase [Symbiobacteriaceae bacterium]